MATETADSEEKICQAASQALQLTKPLLLEKGDKTNSLYTQTELELILMLIHCGYLGLEDSTEEELLKLLTYVEHFYTERKKEEIGIRIIMELVELAKRHHDDTKLISCINKGIDFISRGRGIQNLAELHFLKACAIVRQCGETKDWNGRKQEIQKECLMSRMERNPLKNYAVCTGKDMEILEEQVLFETAMTKNDINLAGYYLKIIKNKMSDTISDRQYVARVEGIYNYKTGQIDAEEYVKCMDRAIRITAPHYEEYLEDTEHRVIYPFTELELYTLMSLVNACVKNGQKNKSIQIYDKLMTCLEAGYMDTCSRVKLQMLIHRNYVKVLGEVGEHHLAIKKAQELLVTAKLNNYGSMLPVILGEIVWNQQMICKKEGRDIKKSADAKRKLQQAYYIAAARKDFADVEVIKKHFWDCFREVV